MGQLFDFRTGAELPAVLSPNPDQVVVTYRGETRIFGCYGDLRAAILIDAKRQLDVERDAAVARGIAADRRERDARQLQQLGRYIVLCALLGSAAGLLAFVAGA